MTQMTTTNQVYDLTGLDGIDDFSSMSVIDSAGLVTQQPKNRISIKGKMFTFQLADGSQVDGGTTLDAVILNVAKYQSKVYFDKPHDDPTSQIVCASSNGKAPDRWVQDKKSTSCALCPFNVIGSGKDGKGKACGDSLDIAILTEKYPMTPFLIRLGVTSIISFKHYVNDLTKQLKASGKIKDPKGIAPLHLFLTKLGFKTRDHKGEIAGFPILDFSYLATLPKDKWQAIGDLAKSEETKKLVKIDVESLAEQVEPTGSIVLSNINSAPAEVSLAKEVAPVTPVGVAKEVAPVTPVGVAKEVAPVTPVGVAQDAASIIDATLAKLGATSDDGFVV